MATAYGAFSGLESVLGVETLATGTLAKYTSLDAVIRLARMQGKLGKATALKSIKRRRSEFNWGKFRRMGATNWRRGNYRRISTGIL